MNVGGPGVDVKVCSPPMPYQGVGAAIVLGAGESPVQGEGRQGIDTRHTIVGEESVKSDGAGLDDCPPLR
jgi:hypothetical protein